MVNPAFLILVITSCNKRRLGEPAAKKTKEMLIDYQLNKSKVDALYIDEELVSNVTSYKYLGVIIYVEL